MPDAYMLRLFFISGFCIPFSSLFALTERDIMKITYHFSDGIKEIEVPQEWADFICELDRQEYNIEHKGNCIRPLGCCADGAEP